MANYPKIAGTSGSELLFQIGGPAGPGVLANGQALEARTNLDALAVVRGALPVGPSDFVTKAYVAQQTGYLNVQDFGATGDGTTDDTGSIQDAFAAVSATQNVVYFPTPAVAYKTTAPITDPVNGLLAGVFGQAGGTAPGSLVKNVTGSQAFLFTHVSSVGVLIKNMVWQGPGRGVASLDGWLLCNAAAALAATSVAAADGVGNMVISMPSTTGVELFDNVYCVFPEAQNTGLFEVLAIVTNVSITVANNGAVADATGGTVQPCHDIGELAIDNCQATGWGGPAAFALHLCSPIVSRVSGCLFELGSRGICINGGTSTTLSSNYMLNLDRSGYELINCSYHAPIGCATDHVGIGYLLRGNVNGLGLISCGHESGTALNLTVTNSASNGTTATITYSGADQSADYYPGISVVVAGTAAAGGALNGRWAVTSMLANQISFASSAVASSAADTGTASVWPGDGYNFTHCTNVLAYACKNTNPKQVTSSAGVVQSSARSGFRDCNFNAGPGDVETVSIDVLRNSTDSIAANCSIPATSSVLGSPLELWDLQSLTIGQQTPATSGANIGSGVFSLAGSFWNGSASGADTWTFATILGTGANPSSTLIVNQNGSTGQPALEIHLGSPGVTGYLGLEPATNASVGGNVNGPSLQISGNFWTGTASTRDTWIIEDILGTGTAPSSTLSFNQSGSAGNPGVLFALGNAAFSGLFVLAPAVPATNIANTTGPLLEIASLFWNGSASTRDTWRFQNVIGAGITPASTLSLVHAGSSGAAVFDVPSLAIAGSFTRQQVTITGAYVIDSGSTPDDVVLANLAATAAVTLPTATKGRELVFKDISGAAATNPITLTVSGGVEIEGVAANYSAATNYGVWRLIGDGTNWWFI